MSSSSPRWHARAGASASTPSSWARGATGRCCASCRSPPRPPAARCASRCSTRSTARSTRRPLAQVIADPGVEIVMHAGRQDVALLRRVWKTDVTNLFDTQLAAGFAGMRAQLGYEALLHELLGVRLAKSASFTRWDARPLSAEQIDYARDDVRHLLQATTVLQERLRAARAPGLGARGVPRAGPGHRRSRPRRDLRPPAARELAGSEAARGRARARRVARGHRPHARTARYPPCCPTPRSSRSPSAGRASSASSSRSAASTSRRCAAAGARSSRPSSAAASARRSPSRASVPPSRARSTRR